MANSDKALEWYHKHIANNPERLKQQAEYSARWREQNPDKWAAIRARRVAKLREDRAIAKQARMDKVNEWVSRHPKFAATVSKAYEDFRWRRKRATNNRLRDENIEKYRAREKQYYNDNVDERIATEVRYQERNKDEIRAYNKVRYLRRKEGLEHPNVCGHCGKKNCKTTMRNRRGSWVEYPSEVWFLCDTCFGLSKRKDEDI